MANSIKLTDLFEPGDGAGQILEVAGAIASLSKNHKAFAKNLDENSQKVTAGLAGIIAQAAALKEQVNGLNLLNGQERASLAALQSQVSGLVAEQQRLKDAEAGLAATRKLTTESTRVLTSELRGQQQALKDAFAAGNTEGIRAAAIEILKLKANSEDLNRALRGANSIYTATAGSYRAMENEARQLGTQLKALEGAVGSDAAEVEQLRTRLADVNAALIKFGKGINEGHANVGRYAESIVEAVGSLNQQRTALLASGAALRTQAQATGLSAGEQQHLQTELAQTEAELLKVNAGLRSYGVHASQGSGFTATLSKGAGELATTFLGAYAGIQGVATALQQVFEANIKYSDSVADVAKTTGLTIDQTNELADSLKKLDTRTSLQGLLDIAEVGGQLGVAASDIESFTKVIDVSVQALGNDFSGGASEIATALGKINTVFGKQLGGDLSENLLHIGSALNQLGAVGAATAPQLADVALRTGAIAANAGLGLDKVLSYATVLQEVGVSAETSGSALNRLFSTLSTKTKASFDIAKLGDANLTLKEFKRLVNTDFEGAIQAFLKGLNAGGNTTTRMNALLATLKLQSGEAKSAIVTLAGNLDLYAQRQAVANQELKTGTSVAAEAAIKNDTLGGSYEKLKNSLSNLFTNSALGDFFKDAIDLQRERFDQLAAGFNKLGEAFDYLKQKAGFAKKPVEDFTLSIVAHTKSLRAQADAQQGLLDSYTKLDTVTARSGQQELDLAQARAKLVAQFGGADAKAIQARIDGLRQEAAANKGELETKLKDYTAYVEETAKETAKLQETANQAAVAFSKFGLSAEGTKNLQDAAASGALMNQVMGRSFPADQVAGARDLNKAQENLAVSTEKLTKGKQDLARIAAALAKLNGAATTKEQTRATDNDVAADKKKKQSVADVAKEEYELHKQRLQAQVTDFDRQADNPANSEAIRTAAVAKGVEARKQLAQLEQDELIREAAQTNKEKVNGEQATAVARQRISEAFRNATAEIERTGDQKLLTLRNALLGQLVALDKVQLEAEAEALDKTAQDENKSYQERQQAALDASARRIEVIELESAVKRRLAKGDAQELARIDAEADKLKAAELQKTRSPNADLANKDLDKEYRTAQSKLEESLGGELAARRSYTSAAEGLELEFLTKKLANLKADSTKQQEAADLELEIERRKNASKLKQEEETQARKQQIIQQAFATTQAISDAFFTIGSDRRSAELEEAQRVHDYEIQAAGDNLELKEQREKEYQKRQADIKRKQAVADKEQALFNVALNTAMAVTSVLSTGGGTRYADFGISAGVLSALVIASGVAQAAAILAKPLPAYFKGRAGGPAEFAQLGERGPELVGRPGSFRLVAQPTVGYLQAGDQVITAPKTQQILQQHELVEGRLIYRAQQLDLERSTTRLRANAVHEQARQQTVSQQHHAQLVQELRQVRRAVESQEQLRAAEGELQRWQRNGDSWQRHLNKRYRGGE